MWDRLTSVCIKAVQGIFLLRWRGLHVGRVGELGKIYLENHPQILWSWLSPIYTVILTTINHLYSCNWKISKVTLLPRLWPRASAVAEVLWSPSQVRIFRFQVLLRREFLGLRFFSGESSKPLTSWESGHPSHLWWKRLAPNCTFLFDTCKVIHIVCTVLKDL